MTEPLKFIVYVDGSTRPKNPSYSGFGIYGYLLKPSKRPSKIKHPIKLKLNYTTSGITEDKETDPYETVSIVEYIGALNTHLGTNNLAELMGFIKTLELALELNVTHVKIISDSKYVLSNYTDSLPRWKSNGWLKKDQEPIAHKEHWELIDKLSEQLISRGCEIEPTWVKGHSEDYGNDTADLYSVIGSNAARIQLLETPEIPFNETVYRNVSNYADYKKTLTDKDLIYYFRELFFSSSSLDDTNYCFISTSENPNEQGRRDTASIFLTNIGYIPELINDIKSLYRSFPRNYVANCTIKLSKLEDRELARLARLIGIRKLLRSNVFNDITNLHLVKDNTPFVTEFTQDFPYITEVSKIFMNTLDVATGNVMIHKAEVDVTDAFIKEGKIAFGNQDKDIDLTSLVETNCSGNEHFKNLIFVNKLIITLGKDIPNYLTLKHIEEEIRRVKAIITVQPDTSLATLYICIETDNRQLFTTNITNKYLIRRS